MKIVGILLFTLIAHRAQASWMASKCSNSDASVTWKVGEDDDMIHLKYSNFIEGTLSLEIEKVKIDRLRDVTLQERSFRTADYLGSSRVHAGKVRITASEKFPHVLRSQFPENRIITEVICKTTLGEEIQP